MSDRYLGWLETNQTQKPQIAKQLSEFGDYYQKRLWHQLTIALEQSIQQPEFQSDASYLPELYEKFIAGFAYRLNPLRLAKIAVVVSKQHSQANAAGMISTCALLDNLQKRFFPRGGGGGPIHPIYSYSWEGRAFQGVMLRGAYAVHLK